MKARFAAFAAMTVTAMSAVASGEDWTRIYAASDPRLDADGSTLYFSWCGTNWVAAATGGVARAAAEIPGLHDAGPFTNEMYEACASEPALSPDGRRVAFRFRGDDLLRRRRSPAGTRAGEIWLFDGGDGSWTRLVGGANDARSPAWAGDGAIAYLASDGKGGRDVRIRDLATGADALAASCSGGEPATALASSADGRVLVVRRGVDLWRAERRADGSYGTLSRLVFHRDPDGPGPVPFKTRILREPWNDGQPGRVVASPDGESIVFAAGGALWAMPRRAAPGSPPCQPRLIAAGDRFHEKDPVFSPDGSILYHLRDFGDRSEVWAVRRVDSSRAWHDAGADVLHRCVIGGEGLRTGLAMSPEGSRLCWMEATGGLAVAPADGRGPVARLLPKGTVVCWEYAWNPDGSRIALVCADGSRNADVWVLSPDAPEKAVNVSDHLFYDGRPRWSKDGNTLFFVGAWEICGGQRFFAVDMTHPLSTGCCRLMPERDDRQFAGRIADESEEVRLPPFRLPVETDRVARQGISFLKVWSGVKARFPERPDEPIDWNALRAKYYEPAANAASWNEFMFVVQLMFGEIDASHLVFRPTQAAMKTWPIGRAMHSHLRDRLGCACCAARRVHEGTGDRWGYVRVTEMSVDAYDGFRNDLYREGRGREGIILDLRGNGGGSTADAMLASLMTPPHGVSVWQGGAPGYIVSHLERYFFPGKIIALIDERVASNAEMMAHSLKMLGRATLVGRQTAGNVLAASPYEVLDMGEYLMPVGRWWTEDGVEMERNGAVPDVWVDDTPEAWARGEDLALGRALEIANASSGAVSGS